MSVGLVEHIAEDALAGGDEGEGAGGGDAEAVHGFAAEELAYAAAQNREAVGEAAVGRFSGALKLELPSFSQRIHHLSDRNRAAVSELPRPRPELVPSVALRVRRSAKTSNLRKTKRKYWKAKVGLRSGEEGSSGEYRREIWPLDPAIRVSRKVEKQ